MVHSLCNIKQFYDLEVIRNKGYTEDTEYTDYKVNISKSLSEVV